MTQTAPVFNPTIHAIGEAVTAGPWQLTLTNVELGDTALNTMLGANERNGDAPRDLQWGIAYLSATNTSDTPQAINVSDFAGCGAEGVLYRSPLCDGPNPLLQGLVQPGETLEGAVPFWLGDLSNALLWFNSPFLGGAWADAWFALTEGAVMPTFDPLPEASSLGESASSPARFGETVRAGDFDVTLNRYITGQELFDISPPGTRALGAGGIGTWHGFLVTIRNVSSQPRFFSTVALRLTDNTGDPWDHLLQLSPPEPDAARELLPGARHEGWVTIETQPWSTLQLIRVQNNAVSGNARYFTFAAEVAPTPEPVTGLAVGDVVELTDAPLNMRKEPSTSADVVELLDGTGTLTIQGEPVEAEGFLWYPVKDEKSGKEGYVVSNYLKPSGSE